jgi:hypothetical protein
MYNAGGEFYDHEIDGSLRFNDNDNAYLNWTPASAGNRKTWTWSGWVKRGNLGTTQQLFQAKSGSSYVQLGFTTANKLQILLGSPRRRTNRLFRDVGAWYNIVAVLDTTNATGDDRLQLWVNGERLTSFDEDTDPTLNADYTVNSTATHNIGRGDSTHYTDGYLAEVNFIDGQALDPTSFGETKSGIWIPKAYSGSYGTNGFHLEFAGNANDSSGNGNNWTANNISSYDYVPDSPTNNFANLMIHNAPAGNSNAFSEGNLRFTPGTGDSARNTNRMAISNMLVSSGKWYAEAYIVDNGSAHFVGVGPKQTVAYNANNTRYAYIYGSTGQTYVNTNGSEVASTHGSSYTVGDVIGIYVDMDASTPELYFSKNGQWANGSGSWNQSSPTSSITLGNTFFTESADFSGTFCFQAARATGAVSPTTIWNFGQDSTFAGNEASGGNTDANGLGDFFSTVPDDALALCTANLPSGAIDTLNDETPEDYFNTVLYSGNQTDGHGITGVGFEPSLTWIKERSSTSSHLLVDAVRGATKGLTSNATTAEENLTTAGEFVSFDSDGFTVDDNNRTNQSSQTYVGWNWKANGAGVSNTDGSITSTVSVGATSQQNWFSIVGYQGNGSAGATVGHGLGVTPDLLIMRRRSPAEAWPVWVGGAGFSATEYMRLNATTGKDTATSLFNSTLPTSSVVTLGNGNFVNTNASDYIMYAFANAEGLCKVGSYVGNGSTDGVYVATGHRPAYVMLKRTDSAAGWNIIDAVRSPVNPNDKRLEAQGSGAESTNSAYNLDFLSNGFKLRTTNPEWNASGGSYIFISISEQPFKFANAR